MNHWQTDVVIDICDGLHRSESITNFRKVLRVIDEGIWDYFRSGPVNKRQIEGCLKGKRCVK